MTKSHIYDLGFGCLGNGITVYDRNTLKNGDYKNVAHISNEGFPNFYESLPEKEKNLVLQEALSMQNRFTKATREKAAIDEIRKYWGEEIVWRDDPVPAGHLYCTRGKYVDYFVSSNIIWAFIK